MLLVIAIITGACSLGIAGLFVLRLFDRGTQLNNCSDNSDRHRIAAILGCICIFAIAMYTTKSFLSSLSILTFLFFCYKQAVKYQKSRLKIEINAQLVYAVGMLSNAVRAGLPLLQAIENVAEQAPQPLRKEFRTLCTEMTFGSTLESSLLKMANRIQLEDVDLLVSALLVQRQTGGSLPAVLTKLEETMRERQRVSAKVQAGTAQGKLTGLIIVCLPPAMFIMLNAIQPGYFSPLTDALLGQSLILLLVLMDIIGGLAISKICDVKY